MSGAVFASCSLVAAWLAGLAAAAVLADSVTLQPRATVLRSDEFSVGVLGEISSGAEGEYVVVKGKECGIPGALLPRPQWRDDSRGRPLRGFGPHPYEDHPARRVERGREPHRCRHSARERQAHEGGRRLPRLVDQRC